MTYKTYKIRVHDDGAQEWFNHNGKRHRDDGPAVVWPNGYQAFYVDDKRHRDDGPAIVRPDGYQEFWVDGKCLTEEEFNQRTKSGDTCDGKVVKKEATISASACKRNFVSKSKIRQLLEEWEKDYHEYDRQAVITGKEGDTATHLGWMNTQAELLKRAEQLKRLLGE